jgi:hypothetical protein
MTALSLLACSLGRRDEQPNEQLALQIIQSKNDSWVMELVENLENKDKNIQSDCIKVLYEVGQRGAPELIAPYLQQFIKLITGKNNRLVWGAMYAIDAITLIRYDEVIRNLATIMQAVDKGSVITIDCGISILSKLCSFKIHSPTVFPLLVEQIKKCPVKQVPMYAEKSFQYIQKENIKEYQELLKERYSEMSSDSQKKRIEKILKKISDR